ncbi:MAG TPA: Hpt domain-containing protein, partial [Methylomirabilota bacterium]|nr:Hpt domain-containing protein [Methylomirabilota bacterium]
MEPIQLRFIEEAQELLESLAESLLELERAGGAGEAIHDAFRAAHSLKGGARLAGFPQVEAVAQALEECLGQLRDGRLTFSAPLCDLLLRGVDEMKRDLDPEAGESLPPPGLIEALRAGEVSAEAPDQREERERWFRQEIPGLDPSIRQTLNDEQELHIAREVKRGTRLVSARLALSRAQFPGPLKIAEAALANCGRLVGCVSRPPEGEHLVFLFLVLTRESDTVIRQALGEISCELATLTRPAPAPAAEPAPAEPASEALHGIFVEGIGELIEEFSRCLILLEQQPNDPDRVNALFRVGHNLKGIGGSLGFPVLSRIGHEMEAVLDRVRTGTLPVTAELIDSLLGALDSLREIFRAVQEGRELPSEDPPVIGHLRRLYEPEI